MSTVFENTVDTLREVGERLAHDVERLAHEVPSSIPAVLVPSAMRQTGVIPSSRRTLRRHPLLAAGGMLALLLGVVWLVRRRRNAGAEQRLDVVGASPASSAA